MAYVPLNTYCYWILNDKNYWNFNNSTDERSLKITKPPLYTPFLSEDCPIVPKSAPQISINF